MRPACAEPLRARESRAPNERPDICLQPIPPCTSLKLTCGVRIAIHSTDPELFAKSCRLSSSLITILAAMRDLLILSVHLVATIVRLMRRGGARAIVAESLLLKQQLLIVTRPRHQAPDLRPFDRIVAGLCAGLMHPTRIVRSAIVLKSATILRFHRLLVKRKYRELFSPKRRGRPGPKGCRAQTSRP